TRAVDGARLARAFEWTFTTPERKLVESWPNTDQPQSLQPVAFARFDDAIDPAELIGAIEFRASPGVIRARPATAAEIAVDQKTAKKLAELVATAEKRAVETSYVAFVPAQPLPRERRIWVNMPRQPPAYPGQKRDGDDVGFLFHTFGPMRVDDARCWAGDDCPPGSAWWIRFTTPVAAESFKPKAIHIEPELGERTIALHGDFIYISGRAVAKTRYRVTVPAGLRDVFGQTLDEAITREFKVGRPLPQLAGPAGMVVLDPRGKDEFSVFSVRHRALRVRVFRVGPEHWGGFLAF
ncbi:MAG: hypothetical protein GY778_16615, partial [bacterium]|nr:hypothetical protein [bacterium]